MEMSNYLDMVIHDFENICRICLAREDLKPLYDKCLRSTCVRDMLLTCTYVKFSEDDGLPKKICISCIQELEQAHSFAKRCETTDKILRDCLITQLDTTELANNLPQSQIVEAKNKMITEIRPAIILPHINRALKKVLKDCKYVEEVTKKEVFNVGDENDNIGEDFVDESYVKDCTILKESDNSGSRFISKPANSQIKEESWKNSDGFHSAERTNKNLNKIKPECKRCFVKLWDCKDINKLREAIKHYPNSVTTEDSSVSQHQHTGNTKPIDRIYQCQNCEKSFKNLLLLKAHQTIHTAEKKAKLPNETLGGDFHCITCDQAFATRILLQQHSLMHGKEDFLCGVCGSSFGSKFRLDSHLEKVHKEVDPFICNVCGKTFRKRKLLKSHKETHPAGKPEVCSICSETISQNSFLRHIRLHTGEKPYSCEICGNSFVLNIDLTHHKKNTHASCKSHVCSICSKAFGVVRNLKIHMKVHFGWKSHSCEVCSKSFRRSTELTVHKRIHTGEKPYSCSVCGKMFSTRSNMRRHKRSHGNKI